MLTHSHICYSCDTTWGCSDVHCDRTYRVQYHCRPKPENPALAEARRKAQRQAKLEFIARFNVKR